MGNFKMNRHATVTTLFLFALVVAVTVPSASALLFSPLLLRGRTWGSPGRQHGDSLQPESIDTPARTLSQALSPSRLAVDFGHEDDLMRYKHELMGYVYEKS